MLTDIRMPPTQTDEGIRLAAHLRVALPEIGVVVLSQYSDPGYVLELLDARRLMRREGEARTPAHRGARAIALLIGPRLESRRTMILRDVLPIFAPSARWCGARAAM